MKVVLFCGGLGMRLRDYSETIPKPMVTIGYRPVLWYVMKYYAHYGHKDFILCLGHRADAIKNYFLEYNECASNDFVLSSGAKKVELFNSDIHDWRITFADTGINSNIGQRLKAVERVSGRRRRIPRQLQRRSYRPAAPATTRSLPPSRQDRKFPRGEAELELPHGFCGRRKREPRIRNPRDQQRFGAHQRRVLHFQEKNL